MPGSAERGSRGNMGQRRVTRDFTWLCMLALAAAGCASEPLQTQPLDAYRFRATRANVSVAVDPYFTADRTKAAFRGGESFPESGVLPVQVSIVNEGWEAVTFDPQDFRLVHPDSQVEFPISASEAFTLARLQVGWWALLPIVGQSTVAMRNEPLNKDLESRELRAGTVASGGSVSGFVYFGIGQDQKDLKGWMAALTLKGPRSQDLTYEIPIEGRRDIPVAGNPAAAAGAPWKNPDATTPSTTSGTGPQQVQIIEGATGGVIIRTPPR